MLVACCTLHRDTPWYYKETSCQDVCPTVCSAHSFSPFAFVNHLSYICSKGTKYEIMLTSCDFAVVILLSKAYVLKEISMAKIIKGLEEGRFRGTVVLNVVRQWDLRTPFISEWSGSNWSPCVASVLLSFLIIYVIHLLSTVCSVKWGV